MKKWILMFALVLGIGLVACEKSEDANGVSKMNVKMTDAPGNYDSIFLSVKEIEILTSSGRTVIAVNNSEPFNILEFRMGKDTLIASQDIPSGRLQEIRLILNDSGNRIVVNGSSHELQTPSGQSSGVKIKVQEELIAGVAYTLLLDFDAASSIVETGNGSYLLKPVIRAIPNSVSGVITGTVLPIEANAKIYAINGVDTLGAITDANGKFWIPGVAAGSYSLTIDPILPFLDTTIQNVVVVNGQVNNVGTIIIR